MELQIIRASEFIRLDVRAHLDFEESKKALQALVLACRKRGLDRALLDLRTLPILPEPHFTPSELAALVSTFREAGFSSHQRLAILYQNDLHHGIRTFAFVNRMRGLQVHAFTEFEQALAWLSEEPPRRIDAAEAQVRIGPARAKPVPLKVIFAPRPSAGTRRPV